MLKKPDTLFLEIVGSDTIPPHRLAYHVWQNPASPQAVICAHGLTRNGRDFDYLANALSENFRIVGPDMAGRGKSGWLPNPDSYNYATYISDSVQMLGALGLSQVHWVGTSMGGIVGMMIANAVPGLIKSLVLNDIGCLIPATGLKRIAGYVGTNMEFNSRAEAETALRENCASFGIRDENHWWHFTEHSLHTDIDGKTRLAYDPAIKKGFANFESVEDVNLWGLWPGVAKLPVLLIRGEQSDLLTHDTALQMKDKHPNLTYHQIPNTGHAPALMDDAQISLIKNWLVKL